MIAILLLMTSLLATPASPSHGATAADSTWAQHLQAARSAFARDDGPSARYHLLRVDSLVNGHTGAKSALATLAARAGQREAALRWLRALAETGITRAIGNDTTFARWRDDPDFVAVAARLEANAEPIANASVAYSLGDTSLLAEDVVWDDRGGRFLVSSIHRRKIVGVDRSGRVTDFAVLGGDSLWGVYGLALDVGRGVLWATTVAGPECEGWQPADSGRTALAAFDVRSGRLRRRIELPRHATRQVLGDITVGANGTVYASESVGGAVYRLAPGERALSAIVPAGTFRSPQSPVLAADGRCLYVADYPRGIAVIDLATRAVTWMPKPYTLASGGIDGLYRDGARLIAIQNGTEPHRVLALDLDASGMRIVQWQVIEQASKRLGEPNHAVIVGRDLYLIGDSGWDRVAEDGTMANPPGTPAPVLLRLPLER